MAAATSTTSTPAARLGRPRVAASSSPSAAGPPDPSGPAAAEAGVPGAKNPRSAVLEALGDPGAFAFGADPGGTPPAPPPFGVNLLSVLKLGRFPAHMYFDMLVNVGRRRRGQNLADAHGDGASDSFKNPSCDPGWGCSGIP